MVIVVEGNDEAVAAQMLKGGSLGNVRTQKLPGFAVDEMRQIIGRML